MYSASEFFSSEESCGMFFGVCLLVVLDAVGGELLAVVYWPFVGWV